MDKPTVRMSDIAAIKEALPGASKYFIGDALLTALIPAVILLVVIYTFYIRKGFLKKRAKQKGSAATGFSDDIAGIWNMITASQRTTLMGVLIGIVAGLHILVMKGMQIKFGVDNFGRLLTKMGYTNDVSIKGTVFDPATGISPVRKDSLAHGYLKNSDGICTTIFSLALITACLNHGVTPRSGCPLVSFLEQW